MAKWKQDPQGRDFVDEVTEVIELPIYNASAKGKFRPWLKESFGKLEDKVIGATNENKAYIDGLATSKTINSFPLSRATEGEVYKVPNTNKYVICTKNYSGSLISLPNANFEELSVWKNKKKINDLQMKEGELLYQFDVSKGSQAVDISKLEGKTGYLFKFLNSLFSQTYYIPATYDRRWQVIYSWPFDNDKTAVELYGGSLKIYGKKPKGSTLSIFKVKYI